MKVTILKTSEEKEVNTGYGRRLVEQGIAVPVKEQKAHPVKKPKAEDASVFKEDPKKKPEKE